LPDDVYSKLVEQAKSAKLTPEEAAELVLISFFRERGGKLWYGEWKEAGPSAKRIVVAWPYIVGYHELGGEAHG